jgi:hypothetical protein
MNKIACLAVLAALAVPAAALAAYPSTFAAQEGPGVLSPDRTLHFVAAKAGAGTRLSALSVRDDSVVRSVALDGAFGVPMLGSNPQGLGMFRDGSTFVVQSVGVHPQTTFQLVRTADLSVRDKIVLNGIYSYDALSPDGSTLFVTEHKSMNDVVHYVVRAYDLDAHAMLPGRIADKTQKSWVMQGFPVTRLETANGRWAYTLYANPSGFPFVHALDTVKRTAHCVGFKWSRAMEDTFGMRLALRGNKLLILQPSGAVYRTIDRKTWAVRAR